MSSDALLHWLLWALLGLVIVSVAFALRIAVHAGQRPGGVDTWYLMAYAREMRRRPAWPVELPQYLLQDRRQSYPPLFPSLLALLPTPVLERWFWVVSPAIDCLHLAVLYWLTFKITASVAVAAITAAVYAFTPHLVSETRSLSARSFSALLHSAAVLMLLKALLLGPAWPWMAGAVLAGAAVFLASATAAAGYVAACATLALAFREPAYLLAAAGALAFAFLASGGHLRDVLGNYAHAVRFWIRNRALAGAHPVLDSPIHGSRGRAASGRFLGRNAGQQLLRVIGENPFLLALPFAPVGAPPWGLGLWYWAVTVCAWTVLATLLPPLRLLGPGRSYLKIAAFPMAYVIALGIGSTRRLTSPFGLLAVGCLAASALAIAFFFVYTRGRATERTATTPEGLARAAEHLATLPEGGVFCLPYMYADYVAYASGKPILWGAHCGDLRAIEAIVPVIARPLPRLLHEHGVRYVLLDHLYASAAEVGLDAGLTPSGRWDSFELYVVAPTAVAVA
jgi:hypothetical protein